MDHVKSLENLVNFSKGSKTDEVRRFCFGGHAHFTLESRVSGHHYTFEISKKEFGGNEFWFAAVLANGDQYTYIGKIVAQKSIQFTAKSRLTKDAPAVKALGWFLRVLAVGNIPDTVTVYHSGRCGCCGRELTDPESVRCGIGPVCRENLA
jgi:hypothetical protein